MNKVEFPERKTPQLRGALRESVNCFDRQTESVSELSYLIKSKVKSKFRVYSNYPIQQNESGAVGCVEYEHAERWSTHQAPPEDMQLSKGPVPLRGNTVCSKLESHPAPLPRHGFYIPLEKKLIYQLVGRLSLKKVYKMKLKHRIEWILCHIKLWFLECLQRAKKDAQG